MSTRPSTIQRLPEDTALIALGANLPSPAGEPVQTVQQALVALQSLSTTPLRHSRLYRSSPRDCPPDTPDFINAVAMLTAKTDPHALLGQLLALEVQFGRRRGGVVNEARPLDLDLIGFGTKTVSTPDLVLPHPRAAERAFVLRPLADLVPELRLPGWPVSAQALLDHLPAGDLAALDE